MGVFQKIGNALARLMYGRNGVDQLSLAIVVGSLVLDLVSMFVAPHHLWLGNALYLVSIAAWAFALFRIFSRNLTKRRSENQRWVNWMWRMKSSRQNAKARHADKAHKYFTCKNCKTICRVPDGKGKIVSPAPSAAPRFMPGRKGRRRWLKEKPRECRRSALPRRQTAPPC